MKPFIQPFIERNGLGGGEVCWCSDYYSQIFVLVEISLLFYILFQHLRDMNSVSSPNEPQSLSSYPIKVAVLKENHKRPITERSDLMERMASVLNTLQDPELTSFTIKDEPIYTYFDASHLEVRRLIPLMTRELSSRYWKDSVSLLWSESTTSCLNKMAPCVRVCLLWCRYFLFAIYGLTYSTVLLAFAIMYTVVCACIQYPVVLVGIANPTLLYMLHVSTSPVCFLRWLGYSTPMCAHMRSQDAGERSEEEENDTNLKETRANPNKN